MTNVKKIRMSVFDGKIDEFSKSENKNASLFVLIGVVIFAQNKIYFAANTCVHRTISNSKRRPNLDM